MRKRDPSPRAARNAARDIAEFSFAWMLLKTLERLPSPWARWLSARAAGLLYRLTPRWRATAERNLSMAMPELAVSHRERIVRGVYDNLGRILFSFARFPRLTPENIGDWIEYDGREHFDRAIEQGRGVVFMTAHLGNWELSSAAHALFGNPMHLMVRSFDNPLLDRLIDRYRTGWGNRTIRKQEASRSVLRALRSNEAVGILVDQNALEEGGMFVDFFGVPASATSGFVKLAMRTGAALVPGFALWNADRGRYVLKFFEAIEMQSSGDAARDLEVNTRRCHGFLEQVIRRHPDQWLWIHKRWKTRPKGEAELY